MRTGTATTLGQVGSMVLVTITGLTLLSNAIGAGAAGWSGVEAGVRQPAEGVTFGDRLVASTDG
jgi:F0F1-type ATP synthase membrane subunit c/vacuolar-type H+-ATPase subunit K